MTVLPPGLKDPEGLVEESAGGAPEWLPFSTTKLYTNAFVQQNGKLLLGYKKRGLGKDLWNGFGGKLDPNESAAQAAVRELEEEAGITAPLEHCGVLFFVMEGDERAAHIDIFRAHEYTGVITESEEMRPQWFSTSPQGTADLPPIPYDKMWADDRYWLHLLLAGHHFAGRVDVAKDGHLQKWWVAVRQNLK